MKVFLAGSDNTIFATIIKTVQHKNYLFSYYQWKDSKPGQIDPLVNIFNESPDNEIICDSGLFTLMFGAGKGGTYDFNYMKDYTVKYIKMAKTFGINNLTIVESDVHKLLGMRAVFELRKHFEDSGMNVLYVWHKEEGTDGLMDMAKKYPYIALSIPELRILFKGKKERYQTVTNQILQEIRSHVGSKLPKIHLLGNTVSETMETNIAYSCDSTSWKSGGRFGRSVFFNKNRLTSVSVHSPIFKAWSSQVLPQHKMLTDYFKNSKLTKYGLAYGSYDLLSALSYKRYQDFLDIHYPWIGLRRQQDES